MRVDTASSDSAAAVDPGSCWRGVSQDSWWKLLYLDEAAGRWRALCLKAPDHYPWKQPGEEHWLPAPTISASTRCRCDLGGRLRCAVT